MPEKVVRLKSADRLDEDQYQRLRDVDLILLRLFRDAAEAIAGGERLLAAADPAG